MDYFDSEKETRMAPTQQRDGHADLIEKITGNTVRTVSLEKWSIRFEPAIFKRIDKMEQRLLEKIDAERNRNVEQVVDIAVLKKDVKVHASRWAVVASAITTGFIWLCSKVWG